MIIQNARIFIANEIVISQGHFLRKIQLFRFFNNDITPQRAKSVKNLIFQKFLFHINYFSSICDNEPPNSTTQVLHP